MPQQLNPPEMIALQRELALYHPDICAKMNRRMELEEWFAELAMHLDIVLDGLYTPDQLIELCKILHARLYERRTIVVLN